MSFNVYFNAMLFPGLNDQPSGHPTADDWRKSLLPQLPEMKGSFVTRTVLMLESMPQTRLSGWDRQGK